MSLPPTPSPVLPPGQGTAAAGGLQGMGQSAPKSWRGRRTGRTPTPPRCCPFLPWGGREGGGDGPSVPLGMCRMVRGGHRCPAGHRAVLPAGQRHGVRGEWQGWGCLSAERPRRGPLGFPAKAGRSSPAAGAWLLLAWQLGGRAKRGERRGACARTGGCERPPLPPSPG